MEKLYIALVDTPGLFASVIRRVIKQDYIHVALALDADLEQVYTVGRRHPSVPIFAGFTRERSEQILRQFPNAKYRIVMMQCEKEQKEKIKAELERCYKQRFKYHYTIVGLPFILFNRPFYQKNYYTCSSFIARLLSENGIDLFDKHFSLVTPKDFYELPGLRVVYEGQLSDYIDYTYHHRGEIYES